MAYDLNKIEAELQKKREQKRRQRLQAEVEAYKAQKNENIQKLKPQLAVPVSTRYIAERPEIPAAGSFPEKKLTLDEVENRAK